MSRFVCPLLLAVSVALPATAVDRATEHGRVTAVVAGDALEIETARGAVVVQLLGVTAPRAGDALAGGEPHGTETVAWLRATVIGETVTLTRDAAGPRSHQGRPLRYVHLPDGRLLNELLVRQGLAAADTLRRCELTPRLLTLERSARAAALGMWSAEVWRRHEAGRAANRPIADPPPPPAARLSLESYVQRLGVAPWEERRAAFEEAMKELERQPAGTAAPKAERDPDRE